MKNLFYYFIVLFIATTAIGCKKKKNIPVAPSGLNFTSTSTSLTLTWVDNSSNELGFYIQEQKDGSNEWNTKTFVSANETKFTYSIYMLNPSCFYRIIAWNDDGESEASNSVYVPTYSTAMAYIYVCPSSATGICNHNYLILDGTCRQVTSEYNKGGWYNTGFEVTASNNYAI